jgi:sulfoxide reductase heme-binding subunit YedZ
VATRRARADSLDWLQPAVLVGCLVPFAVLAWRAAKGSLGANPIATALNQLGLLGLILLLATLTCTPLRILGAPWAMRVRRTLGVMSFVAVLAHFGVYVGLDRGFDGSALADDLGKRPFILIGFTAFLLLIPLAVTSTRGSVKALGSRNWRRLHRLVYVCAVLGVIHFYYRVKADVTEPLTYGTFLGALLLARVADTWRKRARALDDG